MRASRCFQLRFLVVVIANILTTYAAPTAFYFFGADNNGERMQFHVDPNPNNCFIGTLPHDWKANWPTCLLIHGYFENPSYAGTSSILIKQALLKAGRKCNIVIVDWNLNAGFGDIRTNWHQRPGGNYGPDDYNLVTASPAHFTAFTTNVPDTGDQVARFISWLRKTVTENKDFKNDGQGLVVTAFVHSMGSQVVACAAQVLAIRKEAQIETIIVTDPPSRNTSAEKSPAIVYLNYLSKESAHRVILIKTNAGGFGSHGVDGHLIFYINNEYIMIEKSSDDSAAMLDNVNGEDTLKWVQVQPGFTKQNPGPDTLFYSHNLAPKFLAEQIVNPETLDCYGQQITLFGEDVVVKDLPLEGLLVVLSWKNNGPPTVNLQSYAGWAEINDDVPNFPSNIQTADCKPVIKKELDGGKGACPAKVDFTPNPRSYDNKIGKRVSERLYSNL